MKLLPTRTIVGAMAFLLAASLGGANAQTAQAAKSNACGRYQVLGNSGATGFDGTVAAPADGRVMLQSRRAARPAADLSAREEEVLRLVAAGMVNKQIARRLGITERTVKAHLTRVFHTLGVTDRTQAALWAQEHWRDRPST